MELELGRAILFEMLDKKKYFVFGNTNIFHMRRRVNATEMQRMKTQLSAVCV